MLSPDATNLILEAGGDMRSGLLKKSFTEVPTACGVVVTYSPREGCGADGHERKSRREMARRLATLKGYDFAGEHEESCRYSAPVYFVPGDTLVGLDVASKLGIASEEDLFGGIVPHPFMATKAITHPLVAAHSYSPPGWSHDFARCVRDSVLPGYTVFTHSDAMRACQALLEQGPVRVKRARGVAGRGQLVVHSLAELEAFLGDLEPAELSREGLVIEQNLTNVTTYSVGQVRVGAVVATYYGTQRLTQDNAGESVYGGSDLTVVRGGYDDLLRLEIPPPARLAIAQARLYDDAADRAFPGLLASRRNYDVAQGADAQGQGRSGVLEQSWRLGGASGAEIAALEAFAADPVLAAAHARSIEAYGADHCPPPQAIIAFRGVDDHVGPLSKYTLVEPYVGASRA